MFGQQCKSCVAGWVPPSLGHSALEIAPSQPAMPTAALYEAPSPDEDAKPRSAHQVAKDVPRANVVGEGHHQGLFGLQEYNSASDSESPSSDHSASQPDQNMFGVMGPFF